MFKMIQRWVQMGLVLIVFILFMNFDEFFKKDRVLDKAEAKIVRVIDGDTLEVVTDQGIKERVRLLLIDTPESVHPDFPAEYLGEEASDFAQQILVQGDCVLLEIGNPNRDKFDRLLAYVWIDDLNFNLLMVEKGFARVAYVYEPNTKYLKEFEKAEAHARRQELRIWSIKDYVQDFGFDMSVFD